MAFLGGSCGAFSSQPFTGSLNSIRRETRSVFGGDRHQQPPLPFEFDRERSRSNGDRAVFPTNIKPHSWFYSGVAANIFWNHQSAGVIDGRFHGMKNTMFFTVCQSKVDSGEEATVGRENACLYFCCFPFDSTNRRACRKSTGMSTSQGGSRHVFSRLRCQTRRLTTLTRAV